MNWVVKFLILHTKNQLATILKKTTSPKYMGETDKNSKVGKIGRGSGPPRPQRGAAREAKPPRRKLNLSIFICKIWLLLAPEYTNNIIVFSLKHAFKWSKITPKKKTINMTSKLDKKISFLKLKSVNNKTYQIKKMFRLF